ncbi:MAG: hypothetical protein E5Y18_02910, partial [Mesorhizobium sp.]
GFTRKLRNSQRFAGGSFGTVREALIGLWEASGRICGKRLKTLIPILVEAMSVMRIPSNSRDRYPVSGRAIAFES